MSDMEAHSGPIKLVILPRTRRDLDRAGLRRHLETVHAPMVMSEPEVSGVFVTYAHHYTQDCPVGPVLEDRDAVAMFRFASMADSVASKESPGYREKIGPDEGNFSEREGTVFLLAQEHVVLAGADSAPRKLFVFHCSSDGGIDDHAAALAPIAQLPGVKGIITNTLETIGGVLEFRAFDEIGISNDADIPALAQALKMITDAESDAATGISFLLTETVRFK